MVRNWQRALACLLLVWVFLDVALSAKGRIEEARGRLAGALVRFRDNPLVEFDAGPRFTPEGSRSGIWLFAEFRTGRSSIARSHSFQSVNPVSGE